jgi:hypothetical protein
MRHYTPDTFQAGLRKTLETPLNSDIKWVDGILKIDCNDLFVRQLKASFPRRHHLAQIADRWGFKYVYLYVDGRKRLSFAPQLTVRMAQRQD